MKNNTNFEGIESFIENSPFKIESQDDFDNLDENELDRYVNEFTNFSSWEEMKKEAGALYTKRKLGL